MNKPQINLANVRVASPCPKKWEEMIGDERKRFCSHCQLNVYNFSAMTKAEAKSFLLKAEGRVCGRFYQRADGTMLTQDCPVGLRAVKQRVSKFAAATFSAIFGLLTGHGLSTTAFAQQKNESQATVQRNLRRYDQPAIQGTVTDQALAVIPNAEVIAINQETKQKAITRSGSDGQFQFTNLPAGDYEIQVISMGFTKLSLTQISLAEVEAVTIKTTLKVNETMGEFVGALVEQAPVPLSTNDTILPATLDRKKNPTP